MLKSFNNPITLGLYKDLNFDLSNVELKPLVKISGEAEDFIPNTKLHYDKVRIAFK